MFETLAVFVISGLIGTEVWCGFSLHQIWKERSEERTNKRRAQYRAKAYQEMNERWAVRKNRWDLWRYLQK